MIFNLGWHLAIRDMFLLTKIIELVLCSSFSDKLQLEPEAEVLPKSGDHDQY
jgi:hypothetical protein